MLAAVGRYGFWNYYMNTGDLETIRRVYPAVKRYLSLWKTDDTGLTAFRKGGWTWGDWGDNRDIRLIFAGWHCLVLEGAADMAACAGPAGRCCGLPCAHGSGERGFPPLLGRECLPASRVSRLHGRPGSGSCRAVRYCG